MAGTIASTSSPEEKKNWYDISTIGYNLHLPGLGISQPLGTPYNVNRTPSQVYNTMGVIPGATGSQMGSTQGSLVGYNTPQTSPATNGTTAYSANVPNYTPPTPQPGGGGGGGGGGGNGGPPNPYTTYINGKKLADMIKDGEADVWGNPITGGGGGPSQADLQAEVDATYAPAYANLQGLEDQYRREYPTDQAFIEQSYGQVVPQIQQAEQTQMGGLAEQRTKGKKQEKSQFDQARNRYNELRQGLLTRFGGASSTGQATQELLNRTTNQEMGQIQQNFGDLYQGIAKEETNTKTFFANKLADLEKEKQLKLQALKDEFDTKINQIQQKRGELDSNKAVARLQMLREYAAQARQVQFDNQKMQQQLALWYQMKEESLSLAKQYNAKSFTIPGIPGLVNSFNVTPSSAAGGTTPEQLAQLQGMYGEPTNVKYANNGLTYNWDFGGNDNEEVTF